MVKMASTTTLKVLLILTIGYITSGNQCKNETLQYTNCTKVHYPNALRCSLCKLIDDWQDMTVCIVFQDQADVSVIFKSIPRSTEHLTILVHNMWYDSSKFPPGSVSINLTEIILLQELKYFQIVGVNSPEFIHFCVQFQQSPTIYLNKLGRLLLNIPMEYSCSQIGDIVSVAPQLKVIDFSLTKSIGIVGLLQIMTTLNNSNIEELCFRNFQFCGHKGYNGHLSFESKALYTNLSEIDLRTNRLTSLSPGFTQFAPNLQYLDISDNMLIDISNAAVFVEILILHPSLEVVNISKQVSDGVQSHQMAVIWNNSSQFSDYDKEVIPKRHWISNITNCVNRFSKDNISDIASNSVAFCEIATCIFPEYLYQLQCKNQGNFPYLSDSVNGSCLGNVAIRFGKSLKEIYFCDIEAVSFNVVELLEAGTLCVHEPNTLETIEISNNAWVKYGAVGNVLSNMNSVRGLDALQKLSLSGNNLNFTVHIHGNLSNLVDIDLSYNSIGEANRRFFCNTATNLRSIRLQNNNIGGNIEIHNCKYLENVDLSYNDVSMFHFKGIKPKSLSQVNITHNKVTVLTEDITDYLDLNLNLTIDLSGNPLSCNCSDESQTFSKWVINNHNKIHNFQNIYCEGPHGHIFFDQIEKNSIWTTCKNKSIENIIAIVLVTLTGICFCLFMCAIYRKRWRLRYMLFKLKQRLTSPIRTREGTQTMYKYDAFVSYCAEDRFWVHDVLLNKLEKAYGFRLCIHYRDFPIGGSIAETILSELEVSRKTIIVISENVSDSEWMKYECDVAASLSHKRNEKIILIELESFTSARLDIRLVTLLENHIALKWPQNKFKEEIFWNSVRRHLYDSSNSLTCYNICDYCYSYSRIREDVAPDAEEIEGYTELELPLNLRPIFRSAKNAKVKAEEAEIFLKGLQKNFTDDKMPAWTYSGDDKFPFIHMLQQYKDEIEQKRKQNAKEFLILTLQCLQEYHDNNAKLYTKDMQKIKEGNELQTNE